MVSKTVTSKISSSCKMLARAYEPALLPLWWFLFSVTLIKEFPLQYNRLHHQMLVFVGSHRKPIQTVQ